MGGSGGEGGAARWHQHELKLSAAVFYCMHMSVAYMVAAVSVHSACSATKMQC